MLKKLILITKRFFISCKNVCSDKATSGPLIDKKVKTFVPKPIPAMPVRKLKNLHTLTP